MGDTLTARGTLVPFAGAGLMAAAGLVHLGLVGEHLEEATYLGLLFLADFAGSAAAAVGILRGRKWGWILGAVVAGGAFAAYLVDAAVGLPGVERGGLSGLLEPAGVLAKTLEALFLVVCASELSSGFRRRAPVAAVVVLATAALAAVLILLGAAPEDHGTEEHGAWDRDSRGGLVGSAGQTTGPAASPYELRAAAESREAARG